MQLKPLHTVRFPSPEGWEVKLRDSDAQPSTTTEEEEHFYFAEGKVEGGIAGKFRGANHPHRRVDKTFVMNLGGLIETEDGALIMTEYRGYGRSYPRGRRQVVGAAWYVTDNEKYRWLNDSVCAIAGEVRAPAGVPPEEIKQGDVKLLFDIAEIVWESPQA
jgi:hypothetical protein